jgi:hypothetical protein
LTIQQLVLPNNFCVVIAITPTFEVHFYDQDEKQKIDWFETKNEEDAKSDAIAKHGRIQIIKTVISTRTLAEIMDLD